MESTHQPLDVAKFQALWKRMAAAAADPTKVPEVEHALGLQVSAAVGLSLAPGDGTHLLSYLEALEALLDGPNADLPADMYSFELLPSVFRLLTVAQPGSERAQVATRCACAMAKMCSAREVMLIAVETLDNCRRERRPRFLASVLCAVLSVLTIAHDRLRPRGGRNWGILARALPRCFCQLLGYHRAFLLPAMADPDAQGPSAADSDDKADDGEAEAGDLDGGVSMPEATAGVLAETLLLVESIQASVVVPEPTAYTGSDSDSDSEDEHGNKKVKGPNQDWDFGLRYVLLRFLLGILPSASSVAGGTTAHGTFVPSDAAAASTAVTEEDQAATTSYPRVIRAVAACQIGLSDVLHEFSPPDSGANSDYGLAYVLLPLAGTPIDRHLRALHELNKCFD